MDILTLLVDEFLGRQIHFFINAVAMDRFAVSLAVPVHFTQTATLMSLKSLTELCSSTIG